MANCRRSVGLQHTCVTIAIIRIAGPVLFVVAISFAVSVSATPTVQILSDSHGSYYSVANGSLTFQLYSTGALAGKITSIQYDGQQMVGSKGLYYDVQGTPWIYLNSSETYTYRTGSNFVDISAEHPATTTEPLDVTWHWILRDGESGFSTYLTYHHTTAMADYASSENRFAEFFNDSLFNYSSITDNYWGYQAAGDANRNQGRYLTAETSDMRGIPSQYIKAMETKYDWRDNHLNEGGVTGLVTAANTSASTAPLISAANNFGVWNVTNYRSNEAYNAGPTHPQSPWADGASFIVCPAGSHQGGPSLTYTGNMDKSFGPYFTYFNTGSNVNTMRTDAEQYTTGNYLNSFYDSLNLPYYSTTAQRGTVNGKIRISDGSTLTGATVILSTFDPTTYAADPISQEYQRRAAGYNYWVSPNADGTFSLPDVRPGTYRVTVIKPGAYREATFDNIVVSAGNTTNAGNLTWTPDISGKGVWQIGTFDRSSGEFHNGNNYNNYISTFDFTKDFPKGVNYTVNPANPFNDTQNWRANWPLYQQNPGQDMFNVNFNLASAPAANSIVTVTVALVGQEYINDLAILIGSNRVDASFDHTADNASIVYRSGDSSSREMFRKLSFPGSWLHAGNNTFTFHIVGGNLEYDALRMDIQDPGTLSIAQWDGGSGNWSNAAHWQTQAYGYTAINKGTSGIANDTSTTFADGATNTAPINNVSSSLYYDAVINGGTLTLDTSASVQKLSLLQGTLNVASGSPTLTANDTLVFGGATFNGGGVINVQATTAVNFNNTISGGAKINSIGTVAWTDGQTSVTVTGAGSQWNTPGLSFGQTGASTLLIADSGLVSTGTGVLTVGQQGNLSMTGGTLNTTGMVNSGSLSATGSSIALVTGTLVNSGTATISGGLSGSAVVNTGGTLILGGTNTYTGGTSVTGGVVQFAAAGSIGGSGANVMVNAGGAVSFAPGISNAAFLARLNPASSGALALSNADAATDLNFTAGPLASFASMSLGAIGSVTYGGNYTPAGGIYRLGGGGGTLIYTPAISGSSSLVIGNTGSSGTVIVSAANSFTGTTTLNGGVLSVSSLGNGGANSPLGKSDSTAANLIIDGGSLSATAAATTDRLFTIGAGGATLDGSGGAMNWTGAGSLVAGSAGDRTLTLTGSNVGNIFSPTIADPASGRTYLVKDGSGTWTLNSAAHAYSGDTSVLGGTLKLGANGSLPSGAGKGNLIIAVSGAFEMNGRDVVINGLNDGPAPATGPASPNGNGGGMLSNSSGTHTLSLGYGDASGMFSGVISGGINLSKYGSGTQILSGDNTYTGTTLISAGTLQVGVGGTPSSYGPGDGGLRGKLGTGTIVDNAALVFNRGYMTTCTNAIIGTGSLSQIANAELVLGSANTYTGPTLIGGGIANIGQGGPNDPTGLAYTGDCSINASVLANGGTASSIGASTSAASNLVLDGGTLFYSGSTTATTNRLFTVTQNGGAIYASDGLTFTNGGAIVMSGSGDRTLSLGGDATATCNFGSDIGDPAAGGKTSLTKDRSAPWVLASTASLTYSGNTNMLMGTLSLGTGVALPYGAGKGDVVFGTSTDFTSAYPAKLELNGNDLNINGLSGGLATYSIVDNNSGTHTLSLGNNNATTEFAGQITGGINLIKVGSGTQTIDGTCTYTGGTTVSGGALIFSATATIGGSGKNVTIANGATLGAPGSAVDQTFLNRIGTSSSGVFCLTSSESNNLDFSSAGANLPNVSLGAIGSATMSGSVTANGTTYKLGGGGGTLTLTSSLTGSGNSLLIGAAGTSNGSVGTVILTATNSYGGGTMVNAGTMQFNTAGSIGGSGANVVVNSGAVAAAGYAIDQAFLARINSSSGGVVALAANSANNLDLSSTTGANLTNMTVGAVGAATFSGVLTPAGGAYRFGGGGGTLTLSNTATLSGSASVTVGLGTAAPASAANPMTLSVTAAQSYTGITTIRGGGVISGTIANGNAASALGASSNAAANLVLDGGSLVATGSTDRLFTLTANGGTIDNGSAASFNSTGAIVLPSGANLTLTLTGGNTSHNAFSPILSNPTGGTLSVVKSGTGKWTFNKTGNKTYSGDTHVVAGTLETLASNAFSANSNMVLDSGATLELHDNSATINALVGAGSVVNSFVAHTDILTVGAANGSGTFSGTISSGPTLNFVKNGTGTQVLSGVNAYTGTTTISSGTLALAGNGQISMSSQIINNATLLIADNVASHTVGAITGTGTSQLNDGAQLTATSVVQSTLTIGNGATITIQPIPGGPLALNDNLQSVPEPSTLALLGIGAISLLACTWRRQRRKQHFNNG